MTQQEYLSSEIRTAGVVDKVISRKGGGAIFLWTNEEKTIPIAVQVPYNILPCPPARGEVWNVTGYIVDTDWGEQLQATDCNRALPTGDTFIYYLTHNPRFPGISKRRATNLWKSFGESVFDVLDSGDIDAITAKTNISRTVIDGLCGTWTQYKLETNVVKWLHDYKLPARLSFKIVDYYGSEAIAQLIENPYRLLAFERWKTVDGAAKLLGIDDNDVRRMVAAVEAVLYERWAKDGHTAIPHKELTKRALNKLKLNSIDPDTIITNAIKHNAIIKIKDDLYQHLGANALEAYIKSFFSNTEHNLNLFRHFNDSRLHKFEEHKSQQTGRKFKLNTEQIKAVKTVIENPVVCITGGAGVGKTTILEAIYDQIGEPDLIIQCALTGRAQRRMTEATGHPAMTIARLIIKAENGDIDEGTIIIIDESSMLDVPLFVRLLRSLPANINLYLIGDAYQLPPIGPGLIFHLCVQSSMVPVVELTHIHRAAASTGIPQASQSIRNQQMPDLDAFNGLSYKDHGLSFIETSNTDAQINSILRCYREFSEHGEAQILAYRNSTCDKINLTLHNEHIEFVKANGVTPSIIGDRYPIAEDEPIIWVNVNDYDRDIYNGSMGRLINVLAVPVIKVLDSGEEVEYVAEAEFDSSGPVLLSESDFTNIRHAYAVTCHKARGSQWERVIVAVEDARSIDNSWIYTAITRTQRQVVCVGCMSTFKRLVCSTPIVFSRCVGLEL